MPHPRSYSSDSHDPVLTPDPAPDPATVRPTLSNTGWWIATLLSSLLLAGVLSTVTSRGDAADVEAQARLDEAIHAAERPES